MKQRKKAAVAPSSSDIPTVKAAAVAVPGHRYWPTALVLCAITLLAFLSSFEAGFPMDNKRLLLEDRRLGEATAANVGLILRHSYWWPLGEAGLYRPFTTLTYLVNHAMLGNTAAGYHWINLLLHMGNVLLLWALGLRLLRKPMVAACIAGVWAVHPLVTESVTNIVGRADLLAGMATLGGLLLYLKSTETEGAKKAAWLGALGVTTLIGVFSKESAVVIVGVIALYEVIWWKERKEWRGLAWGMLATVVPTAMMLVARWRVLSQSLPPEFPFVDNPMVAADFVTAKLTALKVVAHYLWLVLWPAGLSADYSYPQIPLATGTAGDWAAWITVAVAVVLVAMCARWSKTALFFALMAAGALLPASNLLFPIGTVMAERLFYVPLMGVVACLVMGAFWLGERFRGTFHVARWMPAGLGVIALALAGRTYARNFDWKDNRTLVEASLKAAPNSFKMHRILAMEMFAAGLTPGTIDGILAEAERSTGLIESVPDAISDPDSWRVAGISWLAKGDLQRTPADLDRGTPAPPEVMAAYQKGRERLARAAAIDGAVHAAYKKKLEARRAAGYPVPPYEEGNAEVHQLLSLAYMRTGEVPKAVEEARLALSMHPAGAEAFRQIFYALATGGYLEEAAVALFEGVFVTSQASLMPDLVNLYKNLDKDGCAVMNSPNGPVVNPACPIVHKDMCAAGAEVLKTERAAERMDLAVRQEEIMRNSGCELGR